MWWMLVIGVVSASSLLLALCGPETLLQTWITIYMATMILAPFLVGRQALNKEHRTLVWRVLMFTLPFLAPFVLALLCEPVPENEIHAVDSGSQSWPCPTCGAIHQGAWGARDLPDPERIPAIGIVHFALRRDAIERSKVEGGQYES